MLEHTQIMNVKGLYHLKTLQVCAASHPKRQSEQLFTKKSLIDFKDTVVSSRL